MTTPLDRAQFLRGDFKGRRSPRRPPWALAEARFVEVCSRGGACIAACPEKILEKGRGGFPQIEFAQGECTFCRECLKVCKSGALGSGGDDPPWLLKAHVLPECLAFAQVVCRTCGEHCPVGAIRFPPVVGGVAHPLVNTATCTGCGACYAPCPKQAIRLVEE